MGKTTKTATLVKNLTGFRGDARLYKLSEPHEGTEFVIVSGANAMFSGVAEGEVSDWGELEGSFRGSIDHERALAGAGYLVGEAV